MRIAILIADGSDGSAHLVYFKDIALANKLADSDEYCEDFGLNEGSPTIIEVKDDWEPHSWGDDNEYSFEEDEEDDE